MPNLLLAGHFGCGNLGDDAILLGFVQGIGTQFDVTVMSGAPEDTYRLYGLKSIPRMDMSHFNDEVEKCDALVFPGGSVFQDATSARSVGYYANLVKRAKKASKKVYLVGQGVGPLTSFFGKRFAAAAFNAADAVVCRDPSSPSLLKSIGVNRPIRVGADLAFLLPEQPPGEEVSFAVGNMKTVGIAPRPFGDKKQAVQLFGDLARLLFQANMMPVLIEMDSKHDGPLIQEISKTQGGKVPDMRKLGTPMNVQGRMARMDSLIAMRLHAGILATTVGIPPFMVSYDPKVNAYAKMLDLSNGSISTEGLTAQRLFENFQAFQRDRERHSKIIAKRCEEFRQQALVSIEAVREGFRLA